MTSINKTKFQHFCVEHFADVQAQNPDPTAVGKALMGMWTSSQVVRPKKTKPTASPAAAGQGQAPKASKSKRQKVSGPKKPASAYLFFW